MKKPLVVLGSWGSGTTSLIGALDRVGFHTCPPYFLSADRRTANTFEPTALRAIMAQAFDETVLKKKPMPQAQLVAQLEAWLVQEQDNCQTAGQVGVAIKLPHLCFFIPELLEAWSPEIVVITRHMQDIERTRQRRNWGHYSGKLGATAAYNQIYTQLHRAQSCYQTIAYNALIADPVPTMRRIATPWGIDFSQEQVAALNQWFRRG